MSRLTRCLVKRALLFTAAGLLCDTVFSAAISAQQTLPLVIRQQSAGELLAAKLDSKICSDVALAERADADDTLERSDVEKADWKETLLVSQEQQHLVASRSTSAPATDVALYSFPLPPNLVKRDGENGLTQPDAAAKAIAGNAQTQ